MLRIFIVLTLSLYITNSFAQINNIKISYDIILNEDSFQNANSSQYSLLDFNAQNTNLMFEKHNNISICYLEFNAEEDILLKALIGISSPIYFDFLNKKRLSTNKNAIVIPDDKYLITYPAQYIWDITTETKQIGNYTCYKAILQKIENSKNTFFATTAWFCPELPINFGFSRYNGLPGMILELHEKHITYMAQNISFNTVSKIELPKLPILSLDEFLKKTEELKEQNPQYFPKEVFN